MYWYIQNGLSAPLIYKHRLKTYQQLQVLNLQLSLADFFFKKNQGKLNFVFLSGKFCWAADFEVVTIRVLKMDRLPFPQDEWPSKGNIIIF